MKAIDVSNVCVTRGKKSVCRNISFSVEHGEVVIVIGPNGAGKSSLLSAIAGDIDIESGNVLLNDELLQNIPTLQLARLRSVMSQRHEVVFPFFVREVVEMGQTPWIGTSNCADDDVDNALSEMELEDIQNQQVTTLSGGEMARVAFARTLVQRANIVLLDEPTASMDIRYQELVFQRVRKLADAGCAVVVVVHDLDVAAAYADKVLLLKDGEVVSFGQPHDVLTPEMLSHVYNYKISVSPNADMGALKIAPHRESFSRETKPPTSSSYGETKEKK